VTNARSRNQQPLGNVLYLFYGDAMEHKVNINSLDMIFSKGHPQQIQNLLQSLIHSLTARTEFRK
jgi:hypothetical protein